MRFQDTVVLSTLALGQAASAANARHASFHARRNAEKRDLANVDWNNVAYDFSNVDWKTINYNQPKATPTPAAQPGPQSAAPQVSAAAVPASSPPPVAQPATQPAVGNLVSDLLAGMSSFSKFMSSGPVKPGVNAKSSSGGIWIGDDSNYKATFTNDGSDTIGIICWDKASMFIGSPSVAPSVFVTVGGGQAVTVSFKEGFSGGCGPAQPNSNLLYGLLNQSILEFTAGSGANGAFDVSREINMNGLVLSAVGSKCTSGVSGGAASCVFGCRGGLTSCGKGKAETGTGSADYNIALGSASNGPCMIGTDPFTGDPSGGCQMGNGGEHIQVTVYDHNNWPSASF